MAEAITKKDASLTGVRQTEQQNPALERFVPNQTIRRGKNELGRDDFLNLLVTQLRAQDPLEPMKNEDFAVNLAQFSQLEQLLAIRDAVTGGRTAGDFGIASYLGRQVTLNSDEVTVEGGSAGKIRVTLPNDATSVDVLLTREGSGVVEQVRLGAMSKGSFVIPLENLSASDGSYKISIRGLAANGNSIEATAAPVGVVSGFVPGPEPKLIIGSQEYNISQVARVDLASDVGV